MSNGSSHPGSVGTTENECAARWQRMEQLFHAAAMLPAMDRESYLAEQCADDQEMKHEVLDLLGFDSSVSELMETPVTKESHHLLRDAPADPWIGRVLDGFRIDALLGRGGMGVVYLGTRVHGMLSQRVAIKLMARHLQSTPAQRQFLAEREALATLEHPHIAKLVGGGVTSEQLPFVAMEYIQGHSLDTAADDPSVTLRQTVQWMLQLCDAVSYAHRNLILHRDLKPGNVMVAGDGQLKLLDFGTLKFMGPGLMPDSESTQAGMRSLTLRYASPEHIRGEAASTALDVYSLGMTLYRLLAGRLPAMDERSIQAYLNMLEQENTPPPSSLVNPERHPQRQRDALLVADLDAITAKAIRFRVADRYDGADALAADLRRALEHKPVSARAGTLQYRTGRFVRRHRSFVVGSALAVVMLTIGLIAMAHEGNIARAESLCNAAGIEQERILAHVLLFDYFDALKRVPGSTDAQRRAVSQALQYLDSVNQGTLNPTLQLDTIQAYTEMGLIQGSQYEENIGDIKGSIVTLTKAVASATDLVSQQPKNVPALQSNVAAEKALGQVYFAAADKIKAVEHLTRAADLSQHLAALPGVTPIMLVQAASTVDGLGDTLGLPGVGTMNDPLKAIERYQQAASVYRQAVKLDPACPSCVRGIIVEDYKLGMVVTDKPQAIAFDKDGLATIAGLPTSEQATPRIARADMLLRQNLGVLYVDQGRTSEGMALLHEARRRLQATVAADPLDARARGDLALCDNKFSVAFDDLHQYPQEQEVLQEFVAVMETLTHNDPANMIWQFRHALAQSKLAEVQLRLGMKLEAARSARESLATLLPMAQKPDAEARVLNAAAHALINLEGKSRAEALLAVSFAARARQSRGEPEAEDYLILAEAEQAAGQSEETKRDAQSALKLLLAHGNSLSEANQRIVASALIKGDTASIGAR